MSPVPHLFLYIKRLQRCRSSSKCHEECSEADQWKETAPWEYWKDRPVAELHRGVGGMTYKNTNVFTLWGCVYRMCRITHFCKDSLPGIPWELNIYYISYLCVCVCRARTCSAGALNSYFPGSWPNCLSLSLRVSRECSSSLTIRWSTAKRCCRSWHCPPHCFILKTRDASNIFNIE